MRWAALVALALLAGVQPPALTATWVGPHTAVVTWTGPACVLKESRHHPAVWLCDSPVALGPGGDYTRMPHVGDRFTLVSGAGLLRVELPAREVRLPIVAK